MPRVRSVERTPAMMPAMFRGKARWIAALVLAISGAVLLLILVPRIRTSARRSQSQDNLKEMGIALHKYHEVHEELPVSIRSKDGTPLLSWRVTMLPFL